jgi:dTDP-4-amino-4,6-dideoxygalactose transaminase
LLVGSGVVVPPAPAGCEPVYHLFVIRYKNRDALRAFLSGRGIQTRVHYPVPVHLQPAYANLLYREGDFPETERASREIISLPFYPEMTEEMVAAVSQAVVDFFN